MPAWIWRKKRKENKFVFSKTHGTLTGTSGPRSFDPSQKQSSGVMMAQGKRLSKIWKENTHK